MRGGVEPPYGEGSFRGLDARAMTSAATAFGEGADQFAVRRVAVLECRARRGCHPLTINVM